MLPEEIEQYFVATLIFSPLARILQVGPFILHELLITAYQGKYSPGPHPAVYLIPKSLYMFLPRQRFLEVLHVGGILVLGSKQAHWNFDPLCILGGYPSGMSFGYNRERCAFF